MPAKWIGFLVFVWVVAVILGSIPQGETLASNETVTNPVQGLMSYTEWWSQAEGVGTLTFPVMHREWLGYLFDILLLDLPLFGGAGSPFQIIRWLIVGPIIATVVFGLVLLFTSVFQRTV